MESHINVPLFSLANTKIRIWKFQQRRDLNIKQLCFYLNYLCVYNTGCVYTYVTTREVTEFHNFQFCGRLHLNWMHFTNRKVSFSTGNWCNILIKLLLYVKPFIKCSFLYNHLYWIYKFSDSVKFVCLLNKVHEKFWLFRKFHIEDRFWNCW